MKQNKWSFYGAAASKPAHLVAWIALYLYYPVIFLTMRYGHTSAEAADYRLTVWLSYSIVAGAIVLFSAIKVKSWLLCALTVGVVLSLPTSFMMVGVS